MCRRKEGKNWQANKETEDDVWKLITCHPATFSSTASQLNHKQQILVWFLPGACLGSLVGVLHILKTKVKAWSGAQQNQKRNNHTETAPISNKNFWKIVCHFTEFETFIWVLKIYLHSSMNVKWTFSRNKSLLLGKECATMVCSYMLLGSLWKIKNSYSNSF